LNQCLTKSERLQVSCNAQLYTYMVYSHFKVGISGYGNLRTMSMDKWAISKSTQLSTKKLVKLLLLLGKCRKTQLLGPSN